MRIGDAGSGGGAAEVRHTIRVAGSEQAFSCAGDDVLLRAAQRAGLAFPYECNVGSCGNCKYELVEGEVEMKWREAPGWTEKDRQRRRFLGCQSRPLGDCTIKLRFDARYAPQHAPQHMGATLVARRAITHDIEEFSFALDRPQQFEPGQYALLHLAGVSGPRAYSMSNTADARHWDFQVRRVPNGRGTAALFEQLQPGQRIAIDGPYGMAWLRRDAPRDILCLAGGSGLAPMVSIARAASSEPALAGRQLHFLYGARTPADVCGEDMLRALPGWGERIHYQAAVSTPAAAGSDWSGPVGFLHDVAAARFGERLAGMEIYFAGPPAMANAMQQMLLARQVPFAQVHFDQFY